MERLKRSRPRQHRRKLKSGRTIVVNKGRKMRRRSTEAYRNKPERDKLDQYTHMVAGSQIKRLQAEIVSLESKNNNIVTNVIPKMPEGSDAMWKGQVADNNRLIDSKKKTINHLNKQHFPKNPRPTYGFNPFKKKVDYISLKSEEYQKSPFTNKTHLKPYGRVTKVSGERVGAAVAASGVAVPVIIPIFASAPAGAAIAKKVDHVKFIKTDSQDKPYKIPRIMVTGRKKK